MKEKLRRYWHWVLATVVFPVLVLFVSDLSLVGLVRTKTTVSTLSFMTSAFIFGLPIFICRVM